MNDGYVYRVSPDNDKVIERQPRQGSKYWYFWCVKDSKQDALRSLARLNGTVKQAELWELQEEL
jgi:hypothetical protein